jgi:hypothetical protein
MYAGSIVHDLEHMAEEVHDAHAHSECALAAHDEATHLDVNCFFCSHGPVLAATTTAQQAWTLAVASLALRVESVQTLHPSSLTLRELRGPPAA